MLEFGETVVTPLAGVWVEIDELEALDQIPAVTPLAGVWVEISLVLLLVCSHASLPLRECGLKSLPV